MRIREVNATDAAPAAALWTEGYTAQNREEGRQLPYDEGELALATRAGTVLVAESDAGDPEPGEVVGIVSLVPADSGREAVARPGEAELARLVITARARGRGVGRAMARRCLEIAREQGATTVVLWSRPYQVAAHSLYESLGFRRTPERDERDRDGRRWVFTLALDPKQ